jgi:hypothetical protein
VLCGVQPAEICLRKNQNGGNKQKEQAKDA